MITKERLMEAVAKGELKTLRSVADHTPRQDDSGRIGVSPAALHTWLKRGTVELEKVVIDGVNFYLIPLEDQLKEDWGMGARYKKRRRGPRSSGEILGFDPA